MRRRSSKKSAKPTRSWPIQENARFTTAYGHAGLGGAAAQGAGFDPSVFQDFGDIFGEFFGFGDMFGGGEADAGALACSAALICAKI